MGHEEWENDTPFSTVAKHFLTKGALILGVWGAKHFLWKRKNRLEGEGWRQPHLSKRLPMNIHILQCEFLVQEVEHELWQWQDYLDDTWQ